MPALAAFLGEPDSLAHAIEKPIHLEILFCLQPVEITIDIWSNLWRNMVHSLETSLEGINANYMSVRVDVISTDAA